MGYVIVFFVSLAVGGAVFAATMRQLRTPSVVGFGDPTDHAAAEPPEPPPGTAYVPVAESRHDWQARLTGVLGLLVSIAVAGIALAVSIYVLGAIVARLFGGIAGGGDTPVG